MSGPRTLLLVGLLGLCTLSSNGHAVEYNTAQLQPTQQFIDYVAADSVAQILQRHLPAQQPLILARPFTTPLQLAVLQQLRKKGYAVEEVTSVADARRRVIEASAPGPHSKGLFGPEPLTLDVHGSALGTDLYHARVNVGTAAFARAYVLVPKGATPAGPWVYKEASE